MSSEVAICRVCKKRPVPVRTCAQHPNPELEAAFQRSREKSKGLCHECATAKSLASLDQSIAHFREKEALGLCFTKGCSESASEGSRWCEGHRPR